MRDDPVARALRSKGPRCQCRHGDQRCGRQATFRYTVICTIEGCDCAAAVYLACTPCKRNWVAHSSECDRCPDGRVTPL
ncbi:MAG TPA: hypothetical protein DEQ43_19830 [Nocardioides bacterium]|nr:hypothetical protein [Nocardioides sp.]